MDTIHHVYRDMLIDVTNCIEDTDLQKMKFRCDQIIKKAESQRIKGATDFFLALEQREYLGPRNLDFLKELLRTCCGGRLEGLRLVERFENEQFGINPTVPPVYQQPVPPVSGFLPGNNVPPQQVVYVMQNGAKTHLERDGSRSRYDGPDLSREISFLEKRLGKDWKFFIRALGVPEEEIENIVEENRTVRERIHQSLKQWLVQEQQGASKYKLIDALRSSGVQRNDLAEEMEDGNYT